MKIIEIKVYTFDELTEKAKDKARSWWHECGVQDDWYESTIEDAKNIGLKIKRFDCNYKQSIDSEFIDSAENCAKEIIRDHGEICETFKTATNFLKDRVNLLAKMEYDENNDPLDDSSLEYLGQEFLKEISQDYLIMLRKELENIHCNEYTFLESGERFG